MDPTSFDLKIIGLLARLQTEPALVDALDQLSHNALVNGFVFATPLFLFWHFAEGGRRWLAQRLLLTILLGTLIGVMASLLLQHVIQWPPPARHPAVGEIYAPQFREDLNPNSFPSDSTMLYSTVAFGTAAWSSRLAIGLLTWLLGFVAPAKIFVGGHYPTDILAGLLLGFCSIRLSNYLMGKFRPLENLASNDSALFRLLLFAWLFEVGNEFHDLASIGRALIHIPRHLV